MHRTPRVFAYTKHGLTRTLAFDSSLPSPRIFGLCSRPFSSSSQAESSPKKPVYPVNFEDTSSAFNSKTNFEIFRAWAILKLCTVSPIVNRADKLYQFFASFVPAPIMNAALKASLFGHFCAGETSQEIKPKIGRLRELGVGGILDFAAEADVSEKKEKVQEVMETLDTPPAEHAPDEHAFVVSRVHEYEGEEQCDAHVETFELAIRGVREVSEGDVGFAAIKLSALGPPVLIERMSLALDEMNRFFSRLAGDEIYKGEKKVKREKKTHLNFEEFSRGWKHFFKATDEEIRDVFQAFDSDKDGVIDYVDWISRCRLQDLSKLVSRCHQQGPLYKAALNEQELQQMNNFLERVDKICGLAKKLEVRVMIDAEWIAMQSAISHIAVHMMRKYNPSGEYPTVFNTYQTYLVSSYDDVQADLLRAQREGWVMSAKVVRGAYMVSERERAKKLGLPSPILPTYEDTEVNYHKVLELFLQAAPDTSKAGFPEVLVATHNQRTIEFVLRRMHELGRDRGVYFGQLLGMADHLTFSLGQAGYKAYKYVPYGPVQEVVPYLIRRTQENSTMLGAPQVVEERHMLWRELRARLRC